MRTAFPICAGLLTGIGPAFGETVQPAVPIDRPAPDYPANAGATEGLVKLRFTVAKDGHVADPAVVESNPRCLFDAAAIAALKRWTYRPRLVDGHPADEPNDTIALRFKPLLDSPSVWANPEAPFYPREALDAKAEGTVKLGFDITAEGTTANVRILESSTSRIFDDEAITEINGRVYRPAVVGSLLEPIFGQTATIEFKLAEARIRPKPTTIAKPDYPKEADEKGITGYCAMDVSIADDGSVSKAAVDFAFPKSFFENSCLSAMKLWKFSTATEAGIPTARHLKYVITFNKPGPRPAKVHFRRNGQAIEMDYGQAETPSPYDRDTCSQAK